MATTTLYVFKSETVALSLLQPGTRDRDKPARKITLDVAYAKREKSQQQGVEEAIGFWLGIQDQVEVLIEQCESMEVFPQIALQQAVVLWLERNQ